jgi:hypothetical protein
MVLFLGVDCNEMEVPDFSVADSLTIGCIFGGEDIGFRIAQEINAQEFEIFYWILQNLASSVK